MRHTGLQAPESRSHVCSHFWIVAMHWLLGTWQQIRPTRSDARAVTLQHIIPDQLQYTSQDSWIPSQAVQRC